MRIGIITFHRAYNCGAMLQAWALKTILERMGHTVEFPACNHVGETSRWQLGWVNREYQGLNLLRSFVGRAIINLMSIPSEDILLRRYRLFRTRYLPERICTPREFDKYYDLIIVGSDQVWSTRHSGKYAPLFFAENIPACIRKIGYAVSYGDEPIKDISAMQRIIAALDRFSSVSVREPLAQQQLSKYTDRQIAVSLDPTLLLKDEDYDEITGDFGANRKPYLFMYTLSAEPFYVQTARTLAKRLGVRCIIAPCYQYSRYGAPSGLTYSISPDRLVSLVRNAQYVLAGSFHGTVMGLTFHKPFLSLRNQIDKYESRPAALLNMIGSGDKIVNPQTSIEKMEELLRNGPESAVYEKLSNRRKESLSWLQKAIA